MLVVGYTKGFYGQTILLFVSATVGSSGGGGSGGVEHADGEALQAWITGFGHARLDDLREPTDKPAPDPKTDIYRYRLVLEGTVWYRHSKFTVWASSCFK